MKKCNSKLFFAIVIFVLQMQGNLLLGQYKTGSADGFFVATGFNNPLPVQLLFFEAELSEESAILTWQTASEINNEKFILEKSFDLQNWFQIYEVKGAGNSYNILNYSFADNDLKSGTQYYRLTQMDFDGQQETFKTIEVTTSPIASVKITVYPNPMKDEVKLSFIARNSGYATLRIYSEYGHEIYKMSMQIIHDENTFLFNSSSLENGIYFFSIETEDGAICHSKVVK